MSLIKFSEHMGKSTYFGRIALETEKGDVRLVFSLKKVSINIIILYIMIVYIIMLHIFIDFSNEKIIIHPMSDRFQMNLFKYQFKRFFIVQRVVFVPESKRKRYMLISFTHTPRTRTRGRIDRRSLFDPLKHRHVSVLCERYDLRFQNIRCTSEVPLRKETELRVISNVKFGVFCVKFTFKLKTIRVDYFVYLKISF